MLVEVQEDGITKIANEKILCHDFEREKTQIMDAFIQIDFNTERVEAVIENVDALRSQQDFSVFILDGGTFEEMIEWINDHVDEEDVVDTMIEEINNKINDTFEVEIFPDTSDTIIIDEKLEDLFDLIDSQFELSFDNYRRLFVDLNDIPVVSNATVIRSRTDMEHFVDDHFGYDLVSREVSYRSNRSQTTTVTQLENDVMYRTVRNDEYIIFLRRKEN